MSRSTRTAWSRRPAGAAPRHGITFACLNVPGLSRLEAKPLSAENRLRVAVAASSRAREKRLGDVLAVDFSKGTDADERHLDEIRRLGT